MPSPSRPELTQQTSEHRSSAPLCAQATRLRTYGGGISARTSGLRSSHRVPRARSREGKHEVPLAQAAEGVHCAMRLLWALGALVLTMCWPVTLPLGGLWLGKLRPGPCCALLLLLAPCPSGQMAGAEQAMHAQATAPAARLTAPWRRLAAARPSRLRLPRRAVCRSKSSWTRCANALRAPPPARLLWRAGSRPGIRTVQVRAVASGCAQILRLCCMLRPSAAGRHLLPTHELLALCHQRGCAPDMRAKLWLLAIGVFPQNSTRTQVRQSSSAHMLSAAAPG